MQQSAEIAGGFEKLNSKTYMTNINDTKPEPISAKPNWHYDSYFLAQLARINPQRLASNATAAKKPLRITKKNGNHEEEPGIEPESDAEI